MVIERNIRLPDAPSPHDVGIPTAATLAVAADEDLAITEDISLGSISDTDDELLISRRFMEPQINPATGLVMLGDFDTEGNSMNDCSNRPHTSG